MNRQIVVMHSSAGLLALMALVCAGCGGTASHVPDYASARLIPVVVEAAGPKTGGYQNFVGAGYGRVVATNDTNATGNYAEINYSREINQWVSLDFLVGYYQFNEDRFSELNTIPLTAAIQVGNEFQGEWGRWYVMGGGGIFFHDFDVHPTDLARVKADHGAATTDVEVDQAPAVFLGAGIEMYRILLGAINVGVEAKHIWEEADVDYVGTTDTDEFRLDAWIIRLNFTYPF